MKNYILFYGLILALGSLFWSCNSDLLSTSYEEEILAVAIDLNEEIVSLKSAGTSPITLIDLFHKDRKVGTMSVNNTNTELIVGFECNPEDYSIDKVQLWVGTDKSLIPSNVNGIPVPGKFPYKDSGKNNFEFTINEADIEEDFILEDLLAEIILVAHVETTNLETGEKESAWSEGEMISEKSNATYSTVQPKGGCFPYIAFCGSQIDNEFYVSMSEDDHNIYAKIGKNTWVNIGFLSFDSGNIIFNLDQDWWLTDLLTPTVVITGFEVPGINGQEIYSGPPTGRIPEANFNYYYGPVEAYNYYKVELKVQNCY